MTQTRSSPEKPGRFTQPAYDPFRGTLEQRLAKFKKHKNQNPSNYSTDLELRTLFVGGTIADRTALERPFELLQYRVDCKILFRKSTRHFALVLTQLGVTP